MSIIIINFTDEQSRSQQHSKSQYDAVISQWQKVLTCDAVSDILYRTNRNNKINNIVLIQTLISLVFCYCFIIVFKFILNVINYNFQNCV